MYGMNVHRAVIENKETQTGITIHFVNADYDEGHIIFQQSVPLTGLETPEAVAEKVHQLELKYFPDVIENVLNLPNQYKDNPN
jgi:phosphoribosylglycinamide formyltransferase-1